MERIIIQIVIGGIIGWVASLVMKTDGQQGLIANIVVGIVGSALGFYVAGALGVGGGVIVHYAIAVGGAALLILILKKPGIFK